VLPQVSGLKLVITPARRHPVQDFV